MATTNNDPAVIAHYFLKTFERIGGIIVLLIYMKTIIMYVPHDIGVPRVIRSDCGTENVNVAFLQPFLRRNHSDEKSGFSSYKYGKSTSNQVRISYY